MRFSELENLLQYRFGDIRLLQTAMTHSSYANEHDTESYERLEFLGDSILGAVTAQFLYLHQPAIPEGEMTRLRAELVCEDSLYEISSRLGFGKWLQLGHGEQRSGGRTRKSILADIVEACIAAMFLDGGLEPAKAFIYRELLDRVQLEQAHIFTDYKTKLQELVQQDGSEQPHYELIGESGPDHAKQFVFAVYIGGQIKGQGTGRSKKEAEQMAACQALEGLTK